jgi:hypothetical protein
LLWLPAEALRLEAAATQQLGWLRANTAGVLIKVGLPPAGVLTILCPRSGEHAPFFARLLAVSDSTEKDQTIFLNQRGRGT